MTENLMEDLALNGTLYYLVPDRIGTRKLRVALQEYYKLTVLMCPEVALRYLRRYELIGFYTIQKHLVDTIKTGVLIKNDRYDQPLGKAYVLNFIQEVYEDDRPYCPSPSYDGDIDPDPLRRDNYPYDYEITTDLSEQEQKEHEAYQKYEYCPSPILFDDFVKGRDTL